MDLLFTDLNVQFGKKQILHKISGMVKKGEMLAVMGPSGAGKSTLLNAISGRCDIKSGHVTLDRQPLNKQLKRKLAYVIQEDLFLTNLTLKETLTYSAFLKLPDKMPRHLKEQRVEEIINVLELSKCANTVIGGIFTAGLSGGEKKRASIALELLTNPLVLLIDEPTSGLDSSAAFNLMKTLKQYTDKTLKTVVVTIHQPSSRIFHMCHNLLLLAEGKMAYYGKTGEVLDFFSNLGLRCDPEYNPADFILEQVTEDNDTVEQIISQCESTRLQNWPLELQKHFSESQNDKNNRTKPGKAAGIMGKKYTIGITNMGYSGNTCTPECVTVDNDVMVDNRTVDNDVMMDNHTVGNDVMVDNSTVGNDVTVDNHTVCNNVMVDNPGSIVDTDLHMELYQDRDTKWATGFVTQYRILFMRNLKQSYKKAFSWINVLETVLKSLITVAIWFQIDRSENNIMDTMGMMFFVTVSWSFSGAFGGVFAITDDKKIIDHERASGMYRLSAYYCSVICCLFLLGCVQPIAFFAVSYGVSGLAQSLPVFLASLAVFLLTFCTAQCMGVLMGSAFSSNLRICVMLASFMVTASLALGDFFRRNMPYWLDWVQYLSHINNALHAMFKINMIYGSSIKCAPRNETTLPACLHDNVTTVSGLVVLEKTGLTSPVWIDVVILCCIAIGCLIVGYLLLRYLHRPAVIKK